MEKMFNFISVIGGLVGGFIVSLFGGWDVMLYTILLFAILDQFTGILKAVYKKELSSALKNLEFEKLSLQELMEQYLLVYQITEDKKKIMN